MLFFWGGGLRTTYTVYLRFIEKLVVDILLIELYSQDVTAEALRANIDLKSAFLRGLASLVVDVLRQPFMHG